MSDPQPCKRCQNPYFPLRRGWCHSCYMHLRLYDSWECTYVDAQPARDHVNALLGAGVSLRQIATQSGITRTCLQALMRGRRRDGEWKPPSPRITARNLERLRAIEVPRPHELVERAPDNHRVPALGTRRRLQALVAAGYTITYLGSQIEWSVSNLHALITYDREQVAVRTARDVSALFDRLQMTPGPSERARAMGKRRGWHPPMFWDEDTLDDPDATAHVDSVRRRKRALFIDDYLDLRVMGMSDERIAEHMGINREAFLVQKKRYAAEIEHDLHDEERIS